MKPAKSVLPDADIDAPDLVCIRVNSGWRDVLMTAMQRYEYPVSWKDGTDANRAEQQVFKWYNILRNAEEDCCDDVCIDFEPSESFIEYFPQNPFTEPDLTPSGYNNPPFYVDEGVVYTDITRVSANPFDWPSIIASGLPRIRVNVNGAVKVGLGLVSIFAGGIIFITKDDDITTSQWYSLTSIGLIDVVAIIAAVPALIEALFSGDPTPEEIYQDQVIEVLFDTPGEHHIDITFVPRVSPETIIGFGGGLSKVEICGQQRDTMEFRQNPDDSCQLQYRKKSTDEWSLMFDYGECMTNNCCDDAPAIYRFTIDGVYERSTDGGATYTPAPDYDPRNTATLMPPTGDDKCKAASNIRHHAKAKADELINNSGVWAGISDMVGIMVGILIFVGIIGSAGALAPLMLALAGAILWTGQAAFTAAMTTEVYDIFQCIIYCHIQDDGSFTDGDVSAIVADIQDQLTGIAVDFLVGIVKALGKVGLTNMARTNGGDVEGDCLDCHCDDTWCYTFDFTIASHDAYFSSYNPDSNPGVYHTNWVSGEGWITENAAPNYSMIKVAFASLPGLRRLEFTAINTEDFMIVGELDTATGDSIVSSFPSNARDFDGTQTTSYVFFGRRSAATIVSCTVSGVGTNPIGSNNC